jgi:aminodeoxyfutalosine synthase
MPVATRPSSLLIRHALEQAGLASLLESRSADTISRTQIETLLRPDAALLAARIAHQRRLDAFGMTTTYARTGDGDEPDIHLPSPAFATWSEALVWGRDHVGSCGPTPEAVVALAKPEGLCAADAGKALKTVGFAALAPTVMPDVADDAWLEQMAGLHAAGLTLTVALPFSTDELAKRWVDRAQHLRRWQTNQPIASAMMIWPKQLDAGTDLAAVPTGFGILQMVALARILVDNVPHLTVPWAMTVPTTGSARWVTTPATTPGPSTPPASSN